MNSRGWWGQVDLDVGRTARWRIDPLTLWISREARQWVVAACWRNDAQEDDADWNWAPDAAMPEEAERLQRHVSNRSMSPLRLLPLLADRPVVTSPRVPLFLLPEETATLYVGSPLWMRIEVGDPPVVLTELPIRRPSDTWFGPSTREGELCYASRTRAALEVGNLPVLPRRAITPVAIRNDGPASLQVDRLKLPVPYLSIYAAASGQLWTPIVSMVSQQGTEMASFEVHSRPPREVEAPKLLVAAREQAEPGLLIRAFSRLRAFD